MPGQVPDSLLLARCAIAQMASCFQGEFTHIWFWVTLCCFVENNAADADAANAAFAAANAAQAAAAELTVQQ
jgi:hypothetical protein